MPSQESKWKLSYFFTRNHSTHDVIWMIQNSNSETLCFACLMEMLENDNELNYKKRRIISEILDILTSSKLIWTILSRNSAVLVHTGKVLMKLLSTKDTEFLVLIIETFSAIIKKSDNENSMKILGVLVESIRENLKKNDKIQPVHVTILGKILRASNVAVCYLVDQNQWLLEKIAEDINAVDDNEAVSYWFIFAQVYQKADSTKIDPRISKMLLKSMSDAITKSSNKNTLMNILSVLRYFSKSAKLKQLIQDHESDEFACSGPSFAEGLKKLLLSTTKETQLGAIQCIIELTASTPTQNDLPVSSLVDKFIDKGLCEFLFELLNSSDHLILESVLVCLKNFTNFQKFFTAGHLVFGLQPIVSALARITDQNSQKLLHEALTLVLAIFQKTNKAIFSQGKLLDDIMNALAKLAGNQKTKTLVLVALCIKEVILRQTELSDVFLKCLYKILDEIGNKLLAEAKNQAPSSSGTKDKMDLFSIFLDIMKSYLILLNSFAIKDQENISEQDEKSANYKNEHDSRDFIYFTVDAYIIPVMLLRLQVIKEKKIFTEFFDLLTELLNCAKGLEFASKLCNSSFIRISTEIKSRFAKANDSGCIAPVVDKFLVKLVCAFEDADNAVTIATVLTEALPALMTSPDEWHYYFTRRFPDDGDLHVIRCCQVATVALLYASARYGDAVWKTETVSKVIGVFLSNESNFIKLPDLTKKQLIYLWSNVPRGQGWSVYTNSQDVVLLSYLSNPDTFESCFIYEKCYIRWILKSALGYKWKKLCLTKLFDFNKLNSVDRIEYAFVALQPFSENGDIFIILCDMISIAVESHCSIALQVVLKLLRSFTSNAQFIISTKEFIHKTILSKITELHHVNISALYDIFRALSLPHDPQSLSRDPQFLSRKSQSLSRDSQLSEIDLKFAFRACNVFIEFPYLDVRISILNFLNHLIPQLHSSRDCHAQISILCNSAFLKEINSLIPKELSFIDDQVERLCAASLVFTSQVLTALSIANADTETIPMMSLSKDALIAGLASPDSKLIQLACIKLWQGFITASEKRQDILERFFGFTQLTLNEAKTILIYIQNLLFSQETILREAALQCFSVLMNAMIKTDNMFQTPWNAFLLEQASSELICMEGIEYNLKLVRELLELKTPVSNIDRLLSRISSAIKQYAQAQKQNDTIESLFLAVVFYMVDNLTINECFRDDLNCFLHKIEDKVNGLESVKEVRHAEPRLSVIEASGIVVPWENYAILPISSNVKDIQQYRSKLTSAMT